MQQNMWAYYEATYCKTLMVNAIPFLYYVILPPGGDKEARTHLTRKTKEMCNFRCF